MVIGIFGESCTGKSTLADNLKALLGAEIYSGKDYLRLDKSESAARLAFQRLLQDAVDGGNVIYVIAETEGISLLPESAVRVLVTAELSVIKERFAARMHGNLPPPVAAMLEKKHGCFDGEPHHIHVVSGQSDLEQVCKQIQEFVR